jgi:hypothetical protein
MTKIIYVAGTPCEGPTKAAQEIARLSGKSCAAHTVSNFLADSTHKAICGVSVCQVDESEPELNWTGIPLTVRVWRDWINSPQREIIGYPCNKPSRPALLKWNPYTTRYGAQP